MSKPRNYEELIRIFNEIGYESISPEIGRLVFSEAVAACNDGDTSAQYASVDSFKYYLNVYFEHVDTNKEHVWLEAHGL